MAKQKLEINREVNALYFFRSFEIKNFLKNNSSKVGVIKGTNELDILRYRRTDGVNYGHENEDIISKISEWNNQFGLTVLGCGRDWLELEFKKLPTDLEAFSHEVYEFCPDSVEQGVGEVENLEPLIIEMNGIWLWWD